MSGGSAASSDTDRPPARPTLVLLVGAPGTGKSYLARALAARIGAVIVSTDAIRRATFPERRYTPAEHAVVHTRARREARSLLGAGRTVIFDATNLEESHRRALYRLAEEAGARLVIVRVHAEPEVVRARLLARAAGADVHDASEAGWDVYVRLREKLEPIPRPHYVVNTGVRLDAAIERLVRAITGE